MLGADSSLRGVDSTETHSQPVLFFDVAALCAEFIIDPSFIRALSLTCRDFMVGVEGSDECRGVLERQEGHFQQTWTLCGAKEEWRRYIRSCEMLRHRPGVTLRFPPASVAAAGLAARIICPLPDDTIVLTSMAVAAHSTQQQPIHCIVRAIEGLDELSRAPRHTVDCSNAVSGAAVPKGFHKVRKGLTSIDLSSLKQVTTVGDRFLDGCCDITSIDFSPLKQVTTVGDYFLYGCSGLTSIDLSSLKQVTTVGDRFLDGCSGLTSMDLSLLKQVTTVGDCFLDGCCDLTSIDLSPLRQVSAVGDRFLYGCCGLTSIDLSPLQQVSVGDRFLYRCSGLTSIDLPLLKQLSGGRFLSRCSGLTSADLSPLRQVTTVESNFLSGCSGLTFIDLSPLKQTTVVRSGFLYGCKGLLSIDLSPLQNIVTVGDGFLGDCPLLDAASQAAGRVFSARCNKIASACRLDDSLLARSLPVPESPWGTLKVSKKKRNV